MSRRTSRTLVMATLAAALLATNPLTAPAQQQSSPEAKKRASAKAEASQSREERSQAGEQEKRETARRARSAEAARSRRSRSASRLAQLQDFHLAARVIIANDAQVRVSRYARQHAENPKVKDFARRMVTAHEQLITKLHRPLTATLAEERSEDDFDFAAMLEEIGERLQRDADRTARREQFNRRTRQPARTEGERREGERREGERREGERREGERRAESGEEAREEARERRDAVLERREEVREERREVAEERREVAEERRELRRERREEGLLFGYTPENEMLRDVVPVLRDNLPEILEALGSAMRDQENLGLAFIELERQIADNYAESVLQKMEQSGGEFGQVYLGYEVAAHLQIISTMEVARRHASPELGELLASSIETMKRHGREAEKLMHELDPDAKRSKQDR